MPETTTLPPPEPCLCLGDDDLIADIDASTKVRITSIIDTSTKVRITQIIDASTKVRITQIIDASTMVSITNYKIKWLLVVVVANPATSYYKKNLQALIGQNTPVDHKYNVDNVFLPS